MFRSQRSEEQLEPPPIAGEDCGAIEVLRVWAAPDGPQQVSLRTKWEDPGAWGLMLVDVARHVAKAYAKEGRNEAEVLHRIRDLFDAEWSDSTDTPQDLDVQ
ncbi:MAG TPA: DUF5076 domain-containing protein [Myxococcota bacterium]|nr:DUF5076 domain-containing protein [Myxococcota bacterium]